jgi:hypothetical protein
MNGVYKTVKNGSTATTDDIETTATGGTSLRYDLTAGQYVYNWKTPSTAGTCYRVTMTTRMAPHWWLTSNPSKLSFPLEESD